MPFYLQSSVYTMPEFLERRYSPAARWYLAVISIIGYVLTKISVTLYAGGIVYEVLLGGNFWTGALIIVVATGIYTVLGGLRAVLYTEMLQTIMLIGGAILVTVIGLVKLGGVGALRAASDPGTFDMWQPMSHPSFPWTGILLRRPDSRCLVLVHRSVHRAARPLRQRDRPRAPRHDLRRFSQDPAAVHLRHSRRDRGRAWSRPGSSRSLAPTTPCPR